MEPAPARPRHEAIDHDDLLVHEWRVRQLTRLGIPWPLAQAAAGHVDWHQAATLVRRGCPPRLALQIVRLGLTGEGNLAGLAARAHRPALDAPRAADGAFAEFTNGIEELLERVLRRFEDRYVGVFGRLDELLRVTQPGAAHARRLRNNFPQNLATLSYFFARAGHGWLVPLREEGFFGSPPEPVIHEDEGTAELPFWPQTHFLVRVAPGQEAEVVATALGIPATGNSRVNSDLIELALRVPADHSARLLPRVIASVGGRFAVLVPASSSPRQVA